MQVTQGSSATVVASQGVGQTATFGIAQTSHMFNVLSSGLYADKIGAVQREVGCNAMDAHIFGRTPERPIQVKLPTELDLQFYIKDWGPGLSDEEVKSIYTVYGVSTKQQSQDQTGGFGLGSKSPFAYTLFDPENIDGFTVVAVKDGKKRVYVCHLDDGGSPAVTDMGVFDADPDWQSGVMVTFPVQGRDIAEFQSKAQEIFQWFKVKPEILGMERPLRAAEFAFEGSFFKVGAPRGAEQPFHKVPAVVMANVRYPIEKGRLRDLTPTMNALLDAGIHIFADNGEVLMAVSREALQYTDKTRNAIMARLRQAADEVSSRIYADVMSREGTKLEWLRKVHAYVEKLPYSLRLNVGTILKEKGVSKEDLDEVSHVMNASRLPFPRVGDGIMGRVYERDEDGNMKLDDDRRPVLASGDDKSCRVWMYRLTDAGIRKKEVVHGNTDHKKEKPDPVTIDVLADTQVFYQDSKSPDARVRHALRELAEAAGKAPTLFMVVPGRGVDAKYAKELAEFIVGKKGIDGLPLAGTSALPVPPTLELDRERRRQRRSMTLEELTAGEEVTFTNFKGSSKTTMGEIEDEAEKFYLVRNRERYQNKATDGNTLYVNERHMSTSLQAAQRLLQRVGIEVAGAVMVETEGTVRRLKLVEQGYKPLLPTMVRGIKSNWTKLAAMCDRSPRADIKNEYTCRNFGLMGLMAKHMLAQSPAWASLAPRLAGHPLLDEVANFALNVVGDSRDSPVSLDLQNLASYLNGSYIDASSTKRQNHNQVTNGLSERYPLASSLFDTYQLANLLEKEPEKAATMLVTALALDPLPEERAVNEANEWQEEEDEGDEVQTEAANTAESGADEAETTVQEEQPEAELQAA